MQDSREILIIGGAVTTLTILLCGFIVLFIFRYRQRQAEFEQEKERLKLAYESEGHKAQLEISEQLMKSISQEIHDNVGQSLTLAKLQINTTTTENYAERMQKSTELLTRAIQDLRDLSRSLSGNYVIENGLENSIRRETELIAATGRVECSFYSNLDDHQLSDQHSVILFRCTQEALNNAMKYAHASLIQVNLNANEERLILEIKDDGSGYDPEHVKSGLGLRNLENRAKILGGTFTISSEPGHGTHVILDVPLMTSFQGTER